MPTQSGNEQGDVEILRRRVGMDLDRFRGSNKQADAAAIRPDEFQELINIEHDGQKPVSRDGLAKFNTVAIGPVRGIFGTDDDAGLARVYFTGLPDGDVVYDADALTIWNAVQPPAGRLTPAALKNGQNGRIWAAGATFSGGHDIGAVMHVEPPVVLSGVFIPILPDTVASYGVDGQDVIFDSVVEAAGRVYAAGLNDSTHDLVSWSYNMATGLFTQEEAPAAMGGTLPPTTLGVFHHDQVWLGLAPSNGTTRLRYRNPATGAWSAPALPGGVPDFDVTSFEEYRGAFHIAGLRDNANSLLSVATIMKWDDAALSVARDLAAGGTYVAYLCANSVDNNLYYAWGQLNAPEHVFVGRYDGTTWTDSYLDLSTAFPAAGAICPLALFEYRGDTHLLVQGLVGGFTSYSLFRHRAGVWTELVRRVTTLVAAAVPLYGRTVYAIF